MKKRNKILLILISILLVVGVVYLFKEYTRAPADLSVINPIEKLKAAQLMNAFENDEKMSNEKYSGKVVEVTGVISSIYNEADTLVRVLLETGNLIHQINCTLASSEIPRSKKYKNNQVITIKGFCAGYLMDVELNRCVIVN